MTVHSRRRFLQGSAAAGLVCLSRPTATLGATALAEGVASMGPPRFVDVDGIRTRYFEAGQGDPLVLIHGAHFGSSAGASHNFMPIFPHLSKQFHVYAFDKIGMGLTDNPKNDADYSMGATVRHALGFITKLGLRNVHLAGHSRGALPAAAIALDRPDLIKTLIAFDTNTLAPIDPPSPVADIAPPGPPPTKESLKKGLARMAVANGWFTDEYVDFELEIALHPKTRQAAERLELLRSRWVEQNPDKVKARPGLAKNGGTGWWLYEVKDRTLERIKAGELKTPTLIIWAMNDPSASYKMGVELMELISKTLDRAQLHLVNRCGHFVFAEYPEETARIVANFINS